MRGWWTLFAAQRAKPDRDTPGMNVCTGFPSWSLRIHAPKGIVILFVGRARTTHKSSRCIGLWWTLMRSTPEAKPAFDRPGKPHGHDRSGFLRPVPA